MVVRDLLAQMLFPMNPLAGWPFGGGLIVAQHDGAGQMSMGVESVGDVRTALVGVSIIRG